MLLPSSLAAETLRADWEADFAVRLEVKAIQHQELLSLIDARLEQLARESSANTDGLQAGGSGSPQLASMDARSPAILTQRHLSFNTDSRARVFGLASLEAGSGVTAGVADVPDRIRSYIAVMYHAGPRNRMFQARLRHGCHATGCRKVRKDRMSGTNRKDERGIIL